MSKPMAQLGYRPESLALAAMMDLSSAGSSLAMPPDPIKPGDPDYDEDARGEYGFLVDTDRMVKHSMVHNHAAMQAIDCLGSMVNSIRVHLDMNQAGAWEPLSPKVFKKIEREAIDRYMARMKETDRG